MEKCPGQLINWRNQESSSQWQMPYDFGACKDSVIMAKEKEIEDIDNINDKKMVWANNCNAFTIS